MAVRLLGHSVGALVPALMRSFNGEERKKSPEDQGWVCHRFDERSVFLSQHDGRHTAVGFGDHVDFFVFDVVAAEDPGAMN